MAETSITEDPLKLRPVRDFKFRSAFALSFADLSPIVGIYTVFAIGLIAAGPAFLWAFPLVLAGQLLVCGVFGNLVSKWPLAGQRDVDQPPQHPAAEHVGRRAEQQDPDGQRV